MFDARVAKALQVGNHLTVEEAPGLRLVANRRSKTWIYRFKSPVDGRMRQIKLGHWPAIGLPAALGEWNKLRNERSAGTDLAERKRQERQEAVRAKAEERYTVRRLCDEYLASYRGHVAA